MDNKCCWVWLQSVLGIGGKASVDEILREFGTAENVYEASDMQRRISNVFDEKQIEKLNTKTIDEAVRVVEQCKRLGLGIVTPDDESYPEKLKDIGDIPLVLYVKGRLDCLKDRASIAMVGSRKISPERARLIRLLSASVAAAGAVIVSGGAMGADTASHLGAVETGRPTVAVLGCGHNARYLMVNSELRERISENGALISEFPPDTHASRFTFPIRNRIISGLSDAVVVLNADVRSGSLVTARLAKTQGRDLFALPGDLYGDVSPGTNNLISDGTKAVYSAYDVLSGYLDKYPTGLSEDSMMKKVPRSYEEISGFLDPAGLSEPEAGAQPVSLIFRGGAETESKGEKRNAPPVDISPEADKIYRAMGREPIHINEIKLRTGLPVSVVNSALMELEINGFIEAETGKYFVKID